MRGGAGSGVHAEARRARSRALERLAAMVCACRDLRRWVNRRRGKRRRAVSMCDGGECSRYYDAGWRDAMDAVALRMRELFPDGDIGIGNGGGQ
jgi:hypothetical protein